MPKGRGGTRASAPLLSVIVVIGLGVAAAPVVFSMFERAPLGGTMINEFRPFMTQRQVDTFRGFLVEIDAAAEEASSRVDPAASTSLGLDDAAYRDRVEYLGAFESAWPAIDADMTDMLDRMEANLDNYAGVDALPPFPLFPWFFVIPGLAIAGIAGAALVARQRGRSTRGLLIGVVVVGVGLVAAPAVFQMFTRAPGGGDMIDDFRTLMTSEKVATVQSYFITIGNGEADLRNTAVPAAALPVEATVASRRFASDWPRINREMAPFVGVMADNVDNFAAVDALPPFALFPWFFVVPGVLLVVLGMVALRQSRSASPTPPSPAAPSSDHLSSDPVPSAHLEVS